MGYPLINGATINTEGEAGSKVLGGIVLTQTPLAALEVAIDGGDEDAFALGGVDVVLVHAVRKIVLGGLDLVASDWASLLRGMPGDEVSAEVGDDDALRLGGVGEVEFSPSDLAAGDDDALSTGDVSITRGLLAGDDDAMALGGVAEPGLVLVLRGGDDDALRLGTAGVRARLAPIGGLSLAVSPPARFLVDDSDLLAGDDDALYLGGPAGIEDMITTLLPRTDYPLRVGGIGALDRGTAC